jgi:membrane fusion protein (multidrug efflux system)
VTEGALVNAGSGTLLTTIEQIDPIYVNFSQSSAELLALRADIRSGALKVPSLDHMVVRVVLEDGSEYPLPGHLDFLDLRIDETTGTAALRAQFPNPRRSLLPGQFVRARIEAGVRAQGLLIPQRAVTVAPQSATVLLVGAKDVVESRAVTLGDLHGASWVILGGLAAGDRVIVDGLQKAMPGQPVRVLTTPPPPDSTAPANVGNDAARAQR